MSAAGIPPKEDLIRYLDGELTGDELRRMHEHLKACPDCRQLLSFAQTFKQGLSEIPAEEFTSKERCPDAWLLAGLVEGEIDDETARHVRAHLLFCDDCSEMYHAARSLRGPNWTRIVLRALEGLWESVSVTGAGALLQPLEAASTARGEALQPARTAQIESEALDPDTGATVAVRLLVNASPKTPNATILLEAKPLQRGWKANLLDAREQEIASVPLMQEQTPIASSLPFGDYSLNLYKGEALLATFELDVRAR